MRDLQTMQLVDDFTVTGASEVETFSGEPRTLLLEASGGGLGAATRVLVNDLGIDDFTIVNDYEVLLRLPSTLDDAPLTNMVFVVYGSFATGRHRVRLIHAITRRPRAQSGLQKLIQQVVRVMLSGPRSNKFDRSSGGGLGEEITNSISNGTDPAAAVAQAVDATQAYFTSRQRGQKIPANERLRSFSFEGILYEDNQAVALVRLKDYSGGSYQVPVVL